LRVGDRPIIGRILDALAPLAVECLALVDDPQLALPEPRLRLLADPQPHAGPLPAVAHGLRVARSDRCMLVASDMPFVSRSAFEYLLGVHNAEGATVVVPHVNGHLEPMHSVVSRREFLEAVEAAQCAGERRIFKVLQSLDPRLIEAEELRGIDPDLRTLFNVNTPEDLVLAEYMAEGIQ
jgi:molybdopterin-guanine dinucleotide biosynthesis protein A